ncbi:response regulator transcription factor [Amylibacter sp. IMCC11727]|uniref:response regulator transcription factor n=1 Tax=Amylibacter sp. IMCC11727 TaxID=3039851 RepID=UPI00244DB428|nr:response regulator transcription factor [Amylibacter sp. IMCC11727]WGI21852.1 response regulator transcription factor [Amylibacter sp. IMCC11727]
MKILVVDDDPQIRDVVSIALTRAEFTVVTASDAKLALIHANREAPDLIVLDVGLPEMDGFEVCRKIRATSDVPILFLTARDDEVDRVVGLELGADDYVTKPFSPRELVARIRAILKRVQGGGASRAVSHGAITLNMAAHTCKVAGQDVSLTGTEMKVLAKLMQAQGKAVSRVALINDLWGASSAVSDRTLDSHLRNLRAKLATAGAQDAIQTIHGVGVRMTL